MNYEVRSYAIEALGKIGVTAIPSLAELLKSKDVLKSKDGFIRHRVITALVRIGPAAKTAIPTLMELIQNEDSEDSVRYVYITEGLAKIGPVAVPALTELCKNKNEEVRDEAVEALGQIGPAAKTAVPTLMKLLADESVRRVPLRPWETSVLMRRPPFPPSLNCSKRRIRGFDPLLLTPCGK